MKRQGALQRLLRRLRPPPPARAVPSGSPIHELARRIDPSRISPTVAVVELDGEPWTVAVTDSACTATPGGTDDPAVTVRASASTLQRVLDGSLTPERAYLTGAVRTSNPALLAAVLRTLQSPSSRDDTRSATRARVRPPGGTEGEGSSRSGPGPLTGVTVIDLTRMVPGAILARQLIDLGARWIKIEAPVGGDPMRHLEPTVGGTGAGFATLLRGAESVSVDLRTPEGIDTIRRLARTADVLVESFRPGTLDRWGLSLDDLRESAPRLITCSISAYGTSGPGATAVAHDLNLAAITGALIHVSDGVPHLQLADVGCGLLASSAILAALLERTRTGRGRHLEQPLATGPLPLMAWMWAESAAGSSGLPTSVLAGLCPGYRRYRCRDGLELVIAAIEPKFWQEILGRLGMDHLAPLALDCGPDGHQAITELEELFTSRPRQHWLDVFEGGSLPVTPVHNLEAARHDPFVMPFLETTPAPGGTTLHSIGPFLPSLGHTPEQPAPNLGEHTAAVLAELEKPDHSDERNRGPNEKRCPGAAGSRRS